MTTTALELDKFQLEQTRHQALAYLQSERQRLKILAPSIATEVLEKATENLRYIEGLKSPALTEVFERTGCEVQMRAWVRDILTLEDSYLVVTRVGQLEYYNNGDDHSAPTRTVLNPQQLEEMMKYGPQRGKVVYLSNLPKEQIVKAFERTISRAK